MKIILSILFVAFLFGLIANAEVVLDNSVVFVDGDYFISFNNVSVGTIYLSSTGISVDAGGRKLWFHIVGGNLSIEKISDNEIVLVVDAPTGNVSYVYISGFKPNRILLNGVGVKRAASINALVPNSYYMNNTLLVLCAEHKSPVVWRLLILPGFYGGLAAVGPVVETPTTIAMASSSRALGFELELDLSTIVLFAALILSLMLLAAILR